MFNVANVADSSKENEASGGAGARRPDGPGGAEAGRADGARPQAHGDPGRRPEDRLAVLRPDGGQPAVPDQQSGGVQAAVAPPILAGTPEPRLATPDCRFWLEPVLPILVRQVGHHQVKEWPGGPQGVALDHREPAGMLRPLDPLQHLADHAAVALQRHHLLRFLWNLPQHWQH